jgi:hypothetical protein
LSAVMLEEPLSCRVIFLQGRMYPVRSREPGCSRSWCLNPSPKCWSSRREGRSKSSHQSRKRSGTSDIFSSDWTGERISLEYSIISSFVSCADCQGKNVNESMTEEFYLLGCRIVQSVESQLELWRNMFTDIFRTEE